MRKKPILLISLLVGFFFVFILLTLFVSLLFREKRDIVLSKEKIAVVEISGMILDSEEIIAQIEQFSEDSSVKAIILRIDSPGGGVVPAQEIYKEIMKVRNQGKKVVVSMGSVAASGGYYIAAASDKIIANPGTITGSIGVIMEFSNVQELMRKVGLKTEIIKSGKFKGIGAPTRPLTEEDKEVLKKLIDDVYEQFIEAVSNGRKISKEKVRRLADGRIYSGRQSIELGLVDGLGNLNDAISEAAKMVGIKGKPRIVKEEIKKSLLSRLLDTKLSRFVDTGNGFQFKLQYIWPY